MRFIICSNLPVPLIAEILTIGKRQFNMVAPICEEVNHTHGKEKHKDSVFRCAGCLYRAAGRTGHQL